ncbi:MAG: enoyl-CoA hydratase/isomerase family protein [Pseudomonadota bacterium]
MSHESLLVQTGNAVTTITLNRPETLNALTPSMLEALADALDAAAGDPVVNAVVITGAGRGFSAGVDLKALGGRPIVNGKVGDVLDVPARRAIDTMATMSKPVIAKVNGHCFTGALELVLGCDLVYASNKAKFGDTHAKWGVRPTWGMSQRMPRQAGSRIAAELALTARTFTADEGVQWRLFNASVAPDALDAHVAEVLDAILANSHDVIAAYKDLWRRSADVPLHEGLAIEATSEFDITDTDERLQGFV